MNFSFFETDGTRTVMICWVDDIAVGYNSKSKLNEITKTLKSLINLKFEDKRSTSSTMEIHRDRKARTLTLTQTQYVKKLFTQHV